MPNPRSLMVEEKDYMLYSIEDAVKLGTTLRKSWFRGNSETINELRPRVFWKNKYEGLDTEFSYVEEFKRFVPMLAENLPPREDHLSWLMIMQHYGVPTRLLDWTESVLVALYFAVSGQFEKDGELWAMNPYKLNEAHNNEEFLYGIATIDNATIKYLAAEPMYKKGLEHDRRLREGEFGLAFKDVPRYPVAVQCPLIFPRMVSQLSTFTIHPSNEKKTIIELLPDKNSLVRYIIPHKLKKTIYEDLYAIGIKQSTLFQDIDSLSRDLDHKVKNMDEEVPLIEPPFFKGI
jgi:hypothetical protein